MICDPCKAGDHCGRPGPVGLRSGSCGCQHRPPGAWKGVQVIAEIKTDPVPADVAARQLAVYTHLVADVDPALIAGCNDQDDCCPDDACKLDAARAAANLPQHTTPRPLDPESALPPSGALAAPVAAVTAEVVAAHPEDPTTASDGRLADLLRRWTENREASGS